MVSKFSQVRVIKGQFPWEPKLVRAGRYKRKDSALVRVIGSFEKSRVREIGGENIELE